MRAFLDRTLFTPREPLQLWVVRALVCASALWLLLSRPMLPELVAWPAPFWSASARLVAWRFALPLPYTAELALWALVHLALVAAMLGLWARWSCAVSALLLYHFAPLEEIFTGMHSSGAGGLTICVLALVILAAADSPHRLATPSAEWQWPVVLVRLVIALTIFVPVFGKLRHAGLAWYSSANIRDLALTFATVWKPRPDLDIASSPWLCGLMGAGVLGLELLALAAPFSPRARLLFVPAMLSATLLRVAMFGYLFVGLPMVLAFVDWDLVAHRFLRRRAAVVQ
jgi:hypothetical protein